MQKIIHCIPTASTAYIGGNNCALLRSPTSAGQLLIRFDWKPYEQLTYSQLDIGITQCRCLRISPAAKEWSHIFFVDWLHHLMLGMAAGCHIDRSTQNGGVVNQGLSRTEAGVPPTRSQVLPMSSMSTCMASLDDNFLVGMITVTI